MPPETETIDKAKLRYLLDTYLDWCRAEALPIHEAVAIDLLTVETAPWKRMGSGVTGAFVHLAGRGDFIGLQVIEIEPGGRTSWQHHLFDEIFYVLSGHGSMTVEIEKGRPLDFEWGPRALFSPPLNCPYRLFNGSGHERVRLVVATDLPFLLNVFRNERFLFDNKKRFPERIGRDAYYAGEGDFLPLKPGKHMWESNFIPDLGSFALPEWETRGAGSRNIKLILADSALHAHSSEMGVGTYKKAHRHGPGAHVFAVSGEGYTLMWREGDRDFERHAWRHGWVFAPPDEIFHQHFNTGATPARYLAISLGSHRYPVLARKVARKQDPERSVKDGGLQLDYADQDPRIHAIWLAEMKKAGLQSQMGKHFDEATIAAEAGL